MNKLDGFGPVYVINLKSRPDRLKYIVNELSDKVSYFHILEGIDGKKEDLSNFAINIENTNLSDSELACSISHLKAIEYWLNNSNTDFAIIAEDDLSLDTLEFWDFSWNDFLKSIPVEYDILQLAIINNHKVLPFLHKRKQLDYSAACYLIKREYAISLLKKYKISDKYNLSNSPATDVVADSLVFNLGRCYSVPLFTYSLSLGSSIHEDHVGLYHKKSRKETLDYWMYRTLNNKTTYPNWFNSSKENFKRFLEIYKDEPNKRFLQIGAYTGDATVWIMDNILTNSKSLLFDVDTWQGSEESIHKGFDWQSVQHEYNMKTLKYYNALRYQGTSLNYFNSTKEMFDFIYIDGDHTEAGVYLDANKSWERLLPGGIMAFDDYLWKHESGMIELCPKNAIDRFLKEKEGSIEILHSGYQVWIKKLEVVEEKING